MKKLIFIVLCLVPLLAACSDTPPSSAIGKQVAASVKNDDLYTVVDVEKTNGRKVDDNNYLAAVTYKLKFKTSYQALVNEVQQEEARNPLSAFGDAAGLSMLQTKFGAFKKGDIKSVKAEFHFVKTEKGWILDK